MLIEFYYIQVIYMGASCVNKKVSDHYNILVDNLSKHYVKQNMTFSKIPEDQTWKMPLIWN